MIRAMRRIGKSTKVTTCERCGRANLKETYVFAVDDGKGFRFLGSECARSVDSPNATRASAPMRFRLSDEVQWAHEFEASNSEQLRRGILSAWDAWIESHRRDPGSTHPAFALSKRLIEIDRWLSERLARPSITSEQKRSWEAQAAHWRFMAKRDIGGRERWLSPLRLHVRSAITKDWLTLCVRSPAGNWNCPATAPRVARVESKERAEELWNGAVAIIEHDKNLGALVGHVGEVVSEVMRQEAYPPLRLVKDPNRAASVQPAQRSWHDVREELEAAQTYTARRQIAERAYGRLIASGTGRAVYDMGNGRVLKVAKNPKGVAQNSVESDGVLQESYGDIIAKVLDQSREDTWLVEEKAQKVSDKRIGELLSLPAVRLPSGALMQPTAQIERSLQCVLKPGRFDPCGEHEDKVLKIPFVASLLAMAQDFDMPVADMCRRSSYGEIGGRLVLVDYGLTWDIWKEHYRRA